MSVFVASRLRIPLRQFLPIYLSSNRCVHKARGVPFPQEAREDFADFMNRATKEANRMTYKEEVPDPKHAKDPIFAVPKKGGLRMYVMNQESKGNLLDLKAIRWLTPRLWMVYKENDITCLLLRGNGKSVFSHGMPLTSLYHPKDPPSSPKEKGTIKEGPHYTLLTEYYQMIYLIFRMHKPIVCYFNGQVNGNASAMGLHTAFRVANEDSIFHLPQTGLGYFPDAGLTHFLARLPDCVGVYLALTGAQIKGVDLTHAGIATHFQSRDDFIAMTQALESNPGFHNLASDAVDMCDEDWADEPYSLDPHLPEIRASFSQNSVQKIMASLKNSKTPWAKQTLEQLQKKSPLALAVTLRALNAALTTPFEDALKSDYRLAVNMIETPDFSEGCSVLVTPRPPVWTSKASKGPNTEVEVSAEYIDGFFAMPERVMELDLPFTDTFPDPYVFQASSGNEYSGLRGR